MKIGRSTRSYEEWLAAKISIVEADLNLKHHRMAADIFSFLRATFYRWGQSWPEVCPDLAKAPVVLAVGDLHIENFGTWRDLEGRLIWGVNDFDEVYPLSYTNDLVRLAVSAHLAIAANHLSIKAADACDAILAGYTHGLSAGGAPFVLSEKHQWLRSTVMSELRDPGKFWEKLDSLPDVAQTPPDEAVKALESFLPQKGFTYRVAHRVAGLGSLGRQRFVALGDWQGAKIAREAKALAPSACTWAEGVEGQEPLYERILRQTVRCPDPFVGMRGSWIVRRLSPDCGRVELGSLPKGRDEFRLLEAMGWETANVHLGSEQMITEVKRELAARPKRWLHEAAEEMLSITTEDWQQWKELES